MPPGPHTGEDHGVARRPRRRWPGMRSTSEVAEGRQAFVVCPLVEDSPKIEAASATAEHERLSALLPGPQGGPDPRPAALRREGRGDGGVPGRRDRRPGGHDGHRGRDRRPQRHGDGDRGRRPVRPEPAPSAAGSGGPWRSIPGTCLLIADPDRPRRARSGWPRWQRPPTGSRLAEEDLKIRGQGTVFGARQSGMADLRLADIIRDFELSGGGPPGRLRASWTAIPS